MELGSDTSNDVKDGRGDRSRKRSPLRAMPLQTVHRTSPLWLRSVTSADAEISPALDLSPLHCVKGASWTRQGSWTESGTLMRRTASLDAIYPRGQWPKEAVPLFTKLLLNKSTQTPEEWIPCCLAEVDSCVTAWDDGVVDSGSYNNGDSGSSSVSNSSSGVSRRASSVTPSVPSSPWPSSVSPVPGDQIEKFIRQRLQRTNKEGSNSVGMRSSPVSADHTLLSPVALTAKTASVQANGSLWNVLCSRPQLSRCRSSVEELNQEIERLVLKPQQQSSEDSDDPWCDSRQDGRRAPIPDYFRFTRSIDTQTPARGSSLASGNSSIHSTPSLSPTHSPISYLQNTVASPDSPGPPNLSVISGASPHINKFLTRKPPDGCERVALKPSEDRSSSQVLVAGCFTPPNPRPLTTFTLLPSLGSAFCPPLARSTLGGRGADPSQEGGDDGSGLPNAFLGPNGPMRQIGPEETLISPSQ